MKQTGKINRPEKIKILDQETKKYVEEINPSEIGIEAIDDIHTQHNLYSVAYGVLYKTYLLCILSLNVNNLNTWIHTHVGSFSRSQLEQIMYDDTSG